MIKAIYPGTFDPLTRGHEELVRRASTLFDSLVLAIAQSIPKRTFFTLQERIDMAREVLGDVKNLEVMGFSGLLTDFVRKQNARVVLRGLRAVSDFEYEFQMALMNRRLNHDLETVFLMPDEKYTYTSSRLIKEVFMLGGAITGLVPPVIEERLRNKQVSLLNPMAGTRKA
jgi:pantetheine-phosphate adenylyltransferase